MDDQDQKPDEKKPRYESLAYVKFTFFFYLVSVVASIVVAYISPPEHRQMLLGGAMVIFVGGAMKLLGMGQVHSTDRKVAQDLKTTKEVENKLNGGFEKRVMDIFQRALDASLPGAINAAMDGRAAKREQKKTEDLREAAEGAIKKD